MVLLLNKIVTLVRGLFNGKGNKMGETLVTIKSVTEIKGEETVRVTIEYEKTNLKTANAVGTAMLTALANLNQSQAKQKGW